MIFPFERSIHGGFSSATIDYYCCYAIVPVADKKHAVVRASYVIFQYIIL